MKISRAVQPEICKPINHQPKTIKAMETGNYNNTWAQMVANLKHEHPHLTDDDFKFFAGYEEQMLAKLQNKLNLLPHQLEELRMQLDELHKVKPDGSASTRKPGWQNQDPGQAD
jgi:uncharacterized protein YjbJ (UPF0337 family)